MFNHQYRYINLATLLSYLQNREIQVSLFWMVFSNCDNIRLSNGLITPQSCYNYLFNGLFVHFHSLQIVKDMWSRRQLENRAVPNKTHFYHSNTVGIWNLDQSGFWMVEKRLGCKWSRFQMRSEIWNPKIQTNSHHCVKNHLKFGQKCI